MTYPWLDVPFLTAPAFVSAFAFLYFLAVANAFGGGVLLALESGRVPSDDPNFRNYWKRRLRWTLLGNVAFAGLAGVGAWTAFGLARPAATEFLARTFFFAWTSDWCFVFLEIVSGFLLCYFWDKFSSGRRAVLAWIFVFAAFFSLLIVAASTAFMSNSSEICADRTFSGDFWDAILNRQLLPRAVVCVGGAALLGACSILFAVSFESDAEIRANAARRTRIPFVLGVLLLVAGVVGWAFFLPSESLSALERSSSANVSLAFFAAFLAVVVLLAILGPFARPCETPPGLALALTLATVAALGFVENLRTTVRAPFVVDGILDGQTFRADVARLRQIGVLYGGVWTRLLLDDLQEKYPDLTISSEKYLGLPATRPATPDESEEATPQEKARVDVALFVRETAAVAQISGVPSPATFDEDDSNSSASPSANPKGGEILPTVRAPGVRPPSRFTGDGEREISRPASEPPRPLATVDSEVSQPSVPRSTPPQSSIPRSTPPQSSVPQSTSPQSSVPRSTPAQPSVPRSTPPQSSVPRSTPAQPSAPQSTPAQPLAPRSTPAQPSAPQSTPAQPSAPQSTPAQPSVSQSTSPQSSVPQSTSPQSSVPRSTPAQPSVPQSTPAQPSVPQSTSPQSSVPQSTPAQSSVPRSTPAQPSVPQSTPAQPSVPQSTPAQPSVPQSPKEPAPVASAIPDAPIENISEEPIAPIENIPEEPVAQESVAPLPVAEPAPLDADSFAARDLRLNGPIAFGNADLLKLDEADRRALGRAVFSRCCADCHSADYGWAAVGPKVAGRTPDELKAFVLTLNRVRFEAPPWRGTEVEAELLAEYLASIARKIPVERVDESEKNETKTEETL